jgi:cytochrome bd ubiquinol oxidase subunit II
MSAELVVAGVLVASLVLYALGGGADFGGGVWDLFAFGPRAARQRQTITHAIGPIWEANHVWLILAIVLTFTCFPPVFAQMGVVLHIPLTLMLVGIVLRGSAFTFRSYGSEQDPTQSRWGRLFAIASLLTPVLLGVSIGAVASGRVGALVNGSFSQRFVEPWLTPFAFGVGVLALALFAFLAAVFLTLETEDSDLADDFRRRALGAAVAVFLASALVLVLAHRGAPLLVEGLLGSTWAAALHLLTGLTAIGVLAALWFRKYRLARLGAGLQVTLIFWGWPLSQYPYLLPPGLTITRSAAPRTTLELVLLALAVGGSVLLPSLLYLFRVFKSGPVDQPER